MRGVNSLALVIAHEMNRNYLADISRFAETSCLMLGVFGGGTTLSFLLSEVKDDHDCCLGPAAFILNQIMNMNSRVL